MIGKQVKKLLQLYPTLDEALKDLGCNRYLSKSISSCAGYLYRELGIKCSCYGISCNDCWKKLIKQLYSMNQEKLE